MAKAKVRTTGKPAINLLQRPKEDTGPSAEEAAALLGRMHGSQLHKLMQQAVNKSAGKVEVICDDRGALFIRYQPHARPTALAKMANLGYSLNIGRLDTIFGASLLKYQTTCQDLRQKLSQPDRELIAEIERLREDNTLEEIDARRGTAPGTTARLLCRDRKRDSSPFKRDIVLTPEGLQIRPRKRPRKHGQQGCP